MRAGLSTPPPPAFPGSTLGLAKSVWSGLKTAATIVGVISIWSSFASSLLAKSPDGEPSPPSLIGSYLSGRFARTQQEPEQAAAF